MDSLSSSSDDSEDQRLQSKLKSIAVQSVRRRRSSNGLRQALKLFNFNQLPDYLQYNQYVLRHYRAEYGIKQCFWSLFRIHNETLNVWTHLFGFFLFLGITFILLNAQGPPHLPTRNQFVQQWQHFHDNLNLLTQSASTLSNRLQQNSAGAVHQLQHHCHELSDNFNARMSQLGTSINQQYSTMWEQAATRLATVQLAALHNVNILQRVTSSHDLQSHKSYNLHPPIGGNQSLYLGRCAVGERDIVMETEHKFVHGMYAGFISSVVDFFKKHPVTPDAVKTQIKDTFNWPPPMWPTYLYLIGVMVCLFCSSMCHLFSALRRSFQHVIWLVDYSAILFLIVTSFYPLVVYVFMCRPIWMLVYLPPTTLIGLTILALFWFPHFKTWINYRVYMFIALGLWGVVPILHVVIAFWKEQAVRKAICYEFAMGGLYLFGTYLYSAKIPERYFPGRFDLLFQSHQLYHVAIVCAALCHLQSTLTLLSWRVNNGGCAADVLWEAGQEGRHGVLNHVGMGKDLESAWEIVQQRVYSQLGFGEGV